MHGIGEGVPRKDAWEKVTGQAEYVSDLALPGMLSARIVRSPYAHARVRGIKTDAARSVAGVVAVVTADDLVGIDPFYGAAFKDQPILAMGLVRYEGEPVAAVVASDEWAAEAGAQAVEVDYEPLPAVLSLDAALAPGAVLVHEEQLRPAGHFHDLSDLAGRQGNIVHDFHFRRGQEPDAIFARPGVTVFEDTVTYPMVHHAALEPYACLADWQGGELTVHTSTQTPFTVRQELAEIFSLALSRVRVVVPYVGGAFGGKCYTKIEPLAVALSRHCGAPVQLCLSSAEAFRTARKPSARVRVRTGVRSDGTIVARHVEVHYVLGAYADVGPRVTQKAGYVALGPYRVPNARIDAYGVYTNTVPAVAFRGYGVPQLVLGYELQTERMADALGLDPQELRRRNLLRPGERYSPDDAPVDANLKQDLEQAAGADWAAVLDEPHTGRGIAISLKSTGAPFVSHAVVRLRADGSATLLASTVEIGQGARTVLPQIVSTALDIPVDQVRMLEPDTAVTPYDQATSSSRSTTLSGLACQRAANDVKEQLREIAGRAWGIDPAQVTVAAGGLAHGERTMTYAEAVRAKFGMNGGEIVGKGSYVGEVGDMPLKGITPFWETGAASVAVRVDPETGEVTVLKARSVADVGKAIHPDLVRGQDEGGLVMGFGHALYEEMAYADGQLVNGNLIDYRVPGFGDVPDSLETVIVENQDGPGPMGAKGVGEGSTTVAAAAIAAAVYRATGVVLGDLPLTPEKIWRAMLGVKARETLREAVQEEVGRIGS